MRHLYIQYFKNFSLLLFSIVISIYFVETISHLSFFKSHKALLIKQENKKNRTDKEYLNIILQTFANGSYYYNLSPENLSGNNYSDFFLKYKEGYCEYFAGTFVLLARLANIPSRIVSGYLGGDLNDIGNFYVFRQKDAHAWAEVWFENEGWVRVDPTRFIPAENVRNTLNDLFNNNKTSDNFISLKMFKY